MTAIPCPHCAETIALLNATEVAARLGITMSALAEKARARGIGTMFDARTRIYTEADADALGRRKGHVERPAPHAASPRE